MSYDEKIYLYIYVRIYRYVCIYGETKRKIQKERERVFKNQREMRASSRFLFFKNQGGGGGEGVPLALTTLICEQTDLVFNILVSIYIIYI